LVTTWNTYLHISGIEVWTGEEGETEDDEEQEQEYNVPANTKGGLNEASAKQSTNYSNTNYLPNWAFKGPSKFSHTKNGVGQWWEVAFNQGYLVDRVKVLNRRDCCGGRLNGTKVMIDDQECGKIPNGCRNGQWYTVKCKEPLFGGKVRLVTTQNTYLHISGIEIWTGDPKLVEEETEEETEEITVEGPATKLGL